MKKITSLCLGISILCSPLLQAGTQIQETSAIGIGAVLFSYGLSLMHKSTKKKGTVAQGLVGALFTAGGAYLATQVPKFIRSKNQNVVASTAQKVSGSDVLYKTQKKDTQGVCKRMLKNEENLFKRVAINIYLGLLKYDPFEMIPVGDLSDTLS